MKLEVARSRPSGKRVRTQQRGAHLTVGLVVLLPVDARPLRGPVFAATV